MKYQLNTRYTFTTSQVISPTGINDLYRLLQNQRLDSEEWKALNPTEARIYLPYLPDDWQWDWKVARGEYTGTMPKRIRQYYWKNYALRCPDSFIETVGQIVRRHYNDPFTYEFDFTNRIDWTPGTFGEYHNSCFWWSDRLGAKQAIEDNGYAIRFYEGDKGIARAWFAPIEDMYIIFNGYGFAGDPTLIIARTFAAFASLNYKLISLYNHADSANLFHVNNDSGYLIGTQAQINPMRSYNLDWHIDPLYTCYECERALGEDDVYYGTDNNHYCDYCFYQVFDSCSYCGEVYEIDQFNHVGEYHERYCNYCFDRLCVTCEMCDNNVLQREAHEIEEKWHCRNCYEKK